MSDPSASSEPVAETGCKHKHRILRGKGKRSSSGKISEMLIWHCPSCGKRWTEYDGIDEQ